MERHVDFMPGEFYHIYNRGVNKQPIFFEPSHYRHFQRLLYVRNGSKSVITSRVKGVPFDTIDRGEPVVDILAYALMSNHFHLLLHEKTTGSISTFMNKLGTAYAMYINLSLDRTGPLMCRPFRAKHIDSDEYLRWIIHYIHANPLEISAQKTDDDLLNYPFSSYPDYYTQFDRPESLILNPSVLPFEQSELTKCNPSNVKGVPFDIGSGGG